MVTKFSRQTGGRGLKVGFTEDETVLCNFVRILNKQNIDWSNAKFWVNAVQALKTQQEGRYKILQGWLGSTCTLTSSPQLSASWRPMAICFKGGGAPSKIRRPMWWVELFATLQAAFQIPASILSLTQL